MTKHVEDSEESVEIEEEIDEEYEEALALAGPYVVEVQSPHPDAIAKLESAQGFNRICEELASRCPEKWSVDRVKRDLLWYVPIFLDPPLEQVTATGERRKIADGIQKHAQALQELLSKVQQKNGSPAFPFQPMLSRYSVHWAAMDYLKWKSSSEDDPRDVVHRTRFAIYNSVTEGLDDLLQVLSDSAKWFGENDAKISRPNNPNARQLYFIRALTEYMVTRFGTPNRRQVLELTQMHFDCPAIDEATISKLAPVRDATRHRPS